MKNILQLVSGACLILFVGYKSTAQVTITLDSAPLVPVNGTTVVINGSEMDSEVNAYMSITNDYTNDREFQIKIVKRLVTPVIDQFCSGVCVENTDNDMEWVFPMNLSMTPDETQEFKPGFLPQGNTFCAINDYYVENQFGIVVDSVRLKFVVGISECFLSTKELDPAKEIKVFPNPSSGQITIKDAQEGSTFEVIDMLGKVTYKGKVNSTSQVIDLSSLTDGVYFYAVRQKNGQLLPTRKLVIRK